jgi:hypothetical protein
MAEGPAVHLPALPCRFLVRRRLVPQVPVLQVMLGQLGIVTSEQMFSVWRWVVVGSTVAAAVLTPSTDPFTQVGGFVSSQPQKKGFGRVSEIRSQGWNPVCDSDDEKVPKPARDVGRGCGYRRRVDVGLARACGWVGQATD